MATRPPNLRITGKGLEDIAKSIQLLATVAVLVGIPAEDSQRKPDPEEPEDLTNAQLLYIHETGAPEQNIPQRPSGGPTIAENRDMIEESLLGIAMRVFRGSPGAMEIGYHRLGANIASAWKNKINDGIEPGLAPATLRARARANKVTKAGRQGARDELERRAKGGQRNDPAGLALAKPLVMTAQMRNAITYVIRTKRRS